MYNYIFILLVLIIFSCKNEPSYKSNVIVKLEEELADSPSPKNADALVAAYIVEFDKTTDQQTKIDILTEALNIALAHELEPRISSLRMGLIAQDPKSKNTGEILLEMAKTLKAKEKIELSDIMFKGIADNFEGVSEVAKKLLSDPTVVPDSIIERQSRKIFVADQSNPVDTKEGRVFINMVEAFAMSNPSNILSADYLFRGMQMARTLGSFQKALSLCDMILTMFPEYNRASSVLFVKAYMLENDFRNLDEAKSTYLEFLEKYPNDDLADDIEILLNNLGKSDDELYKAIQRK